MALRMLLVSVIMFIKVALGVKYEINTLPGYETGTTALPFKLESGYVGVAENDAAQYFYLFVESQGKPEQDPILFWITGGPGCSSLTAFLFEHGPLSIDYDNYQWDGSIPMLLLSNYTWTKNLSIIYFDGPIGTGYSYGKTPEIYNYTGEAGGDYIFVDQIYEFLRKWLSEHPEFSSNQFLLGGDGYSGNVIPILTQTVLNGNEAGNKPVLNVKGYVLGNPGAEFETDFNARYTFANRLALIPDDLYEDSYEKCHGNFQNPSSDPLCDLAVQAMKNLTSNINAVQVLEPACENIPNALKLKTDDTSMKSARRALRGRENSASGSLSARPTQWCRKLNRQVGSIWANTYEVQEALHAHQEIPGEPHPWKSCNDSIIAGPAYTGKVSSVVDYHKILTNTNLTGIIYSGDHDMEISYYATIKWIWKLDLKLEDPWRPWFVNEEVAGYTRYFTKGDFNLTYATVKGAGHFAPEYKGNECRQMIERWMAKTPL